MKCIYFHVIYFSSHIKRWVGNGRNKHTALVAPYIDNYSDTYNLVPLAQYIHLAHTHTHTHGSNIQMSQERKNPVLFLVPNTWMASQPPSLLGWHLQYSMWQQKVFPAMLQLEIAGMVPWLGRHEHQEYVLNLDVATNCSKYQQPGNHKPRFTHS